MQNSHAKALSKFNENVLREIPLNIGKRPLDGGGRKTIVICMLI